MQEQKRLQPKKKMQAICIQKWLEDITQEAQKDSPNTEWEIILKRMIKAARMKQLHLKLTGIVRGGRSGLDYIEVPDNE